MSSGFAYDTPAPDREEFNRDLQTTTRLYDLRLAQAVVRSLITRRARYEIAISLPIPSAEFGWRIEAIEYELTRYAIAGGFLLEDKVTERVTYGTAGTHNGAVALSRLRAGVKNAYAALVRFAGHVRRRTHEVER